MNTLRKIWERKSISICWQKQGIVFKMHLQKWELEETLTIFMSFWLHFDSRRWICQDSDVSEFRPSVLSDSLWPHEPARLRKWHCHFLLQGSFLIQGLNPHLLGLLHWQADSLPPHHLQHCIFHPCGRVGWGRMGDLRTQFWAPSSSVSPVGRGDLSQPGSRRPMLPPSGSAAVWPWGCWEPLWTFSSL